MRRLAILATILSGSAASADERDPLDAHPPWTQPDGYAAGGASISSTAGFVSSGILFEAGARLGRSMFFGRALGAAGAIHRGDEPGRGTFGEGRLGLEGRSCSIGGMACLSAGLDVGIHRSDFTHVDVTNNRREYGENLDAVMAAPRVTLDAGGRIRFRVAVELPIYMRSADSSSSGALARTDGMTPQNMSDRQYGMGLSLSAALAVGF